jgi:hypothetical protein
LLFRPQLPEAGACLIFNMPIPAMTALGLHRYARSCPGPLGLKLRGEATWLVNRLPPAIVPRL